jgi:tRNA G18 (ribose-2'-O)-methylase SpoU
MKRGYCGIGILGTKNKHNTGTLWRSALGFDADFVFTIFARYRIKDPTDTVKSTRHIPLWHFETFEEFKRALPKGAKLIGVELTDNALLLETFTHPQQAIYLIGPEDGYIPEEILKECDSVVKFNSSFGLNAAVAGSIVLYDRHQKHLLRHPEEILDQIMMQAPNEIKILK